MTAKDPIRSESGTGRDTAKVMRPQVEETARAIIRGLRALHNPARAQGVQHYFKQAVTALGINAPTLRDYVRIQVQQLKPHWALAQGISLCDRLLREPELEIRGAGVLMLGAFQIAFTPDLLPWAKRWLEARLDNWALVDGFCSSVLSPLLDRHPAVERTVRVWSGDKSLWVRRAALVPLVPLARRGRMLDLAYELAVDHFGDDEDLMHKATGWLLREAGKTDMPRLREFLRRQGPAIPRTALRYAIERYPPAERLELLRTTRK
jgi:3-methyladenine DNA glycosylase AlkD